MTSAQAIATAVTECGTVATWAPSGPVYLGVPTDFLVQSVADAAGLTSMRRETVHADPSSLAEAVDLLSGAQHPLIWAGGGALRAGAGAAVAELAERLAAPVITTFMGRGILPPHHPCAVPGPVHTPEVGVLWDEADVVLGIGTDFDGMMTQNWLMPAPERLISINVDAADANKNYVADVTLVGDAHDLALELVTRVRQRGSVSELAERLRAIGDAVSASVIDDEPQAAQFLSVKQRVLPDDAVLVADMCIPGYWLGAYWQVPLPRKLAYPVGWGTLGFGFPASLGAALASVGPAVCVTGDGGFLYACGELATAMEAEVPVTIVLVDDGGYGMLRFDQLRAGDPPFGVDLVRPDFVALARSFGMKAVSVTGFGDEFERGLREAIDAEAPRMLVVDASLKPPPTTSPRWYRR